MNNVLSIKVGESVVDINLSGPDPVGEFNRAVDGHDEYRVVGFPLADELGLQWESYSTITQAENVVYCMVVNGPVAMLMYLRKCRAQCMAASHLSQWGDISNKFAGNWESVEVASRGHLNGFLSNVRSAAVRGIVLDCLDWTSIANRADAVGYVWFFKRQDLNQRELGVIPPTIPPIIRELEEGYVSKNPTLTVASFYPLTKLFSGDF